MKGLVSEGSWKELNFFSTKVGQSRGNHYHKNTDELFIVLKGKIEIEWTEVDEDGKNIYDLKKVCVREGDVFIIKRKTRHIFNIIENTEWINGLSQKMDEKNPDIFI
jgi:oxalate decarboxylase/phosphoglucose isomerase-like protein (cupin superfamily)